MLALEVKSCSSREGRNEAANHASEQRKKLAISPILAIVELLHEGRLMRKRRQRMNVREEVVHKQRKDRPRRNSFGVEAKAGFVSGNGDQGLCSVSWVGTHGWLELLLQLWLLKLLLLLQLWLELWLQTRSETWFQPRPLVLSRFGMLIRWSATLHGSFEPAIDVEVSAWLARWARLVALGVLISSRPSYFHRYHSFKDRIGQSLP